MISSAGGYSWWTRRTVLRELKQIARSEEDKLAASFELSPLLKATRAIETNDMAAASALWEDARLRLPNHVLTSLDAVRVLLRLGRLDELEALMREAKKKSPHSMHHFIGFALLFEHRQDFSQAAKWRGRIVKRFPAYWESYLAAAASLSKLGRFKEAAAMLKTGTVYAPRERHEFWLQLAIVNEQLQDWATALHYWDHLAGVLNASQGYAGGAKLCETIGDVEGARERLERGRLRHPYNGELLCAAANFAEKHGRLEDAMECWVLYRQSFPASDLGYSEGARCLRLAGQTESADGVLAEATRRRELVLSPAQTTQ